MQVVIAPQAVRQVEAIDDWWRLNRPAARELFTSELAEAMLALSSAPLIGRAYDHPMVQGVRRVLLRATHFHVYYSVTGEIVEVVAVWSAVRGRGPDLSRME